MPVTRSDDTWDYLCPECGFASTRWPTKSLASARGAQHAAEHETGEPMQELHEFNTERASK